MKSLKINVVLNTVKTFLTLFFPLITFPYSSRVLGPENIGKVNFAQSIVSYFAIIASLGISTYATREAAKVRENEEELAKVVKEIFTINLASTLISYLLLGFTLLFAKKLFEYRTLIIICSSLIIFTTLGIGWIYQALEDYLYITVRSLIFQIISLFLLFLMVKNQNDYLKYAAVNIISNVGANIFNFIHARHILLKKINKKLELKKHLKPIFILFASAVTGTIFSHIDSTMLGFQATDMDVGLYAAGIKIIHMIANIFPAIVIVIFPRISYYFAKNDFENIKILSAKSIKYLTGLSIPVAAGLFILVKPLILLLCGDKYLQAINVTKIMSPYIVLTAVNIFVGSNLLIAYGKERYRLISVIAASILDIILNYILIPSYGAFGAAFATLITELSLFLFHIIYFHKFFKQLKLLKSILQFCLAAIIMAFGVYYCKNTIDGYISELFISIIVGVLIYFFTLLLLKNESLYEILFALKKKIKGQKNENICNNDGKK